MTYGQLLCLFPQNTDRKQKGGENPEDYELQYIFLRLFFHHTLIFNFVFWRKQLKTAMQLFSHV